jgi:hypothetical protein
MRLILDGMETFFFAGHNASSSVLYYVYNLPNLNSKSLAEIVVEQSEVFGNDTSITADIKKIPQLLDKLPYTLAIVKGTLPLSFT